LVDDVWQSRAGLGMRAVDERNAHNLAVDLVSAGAPALNG